MKEEMERLYGSERIEDTKGKKKKSFKKSRRRTNTDMNSRRLWYHVQSLQVSVSDGASELRNERTKKTLSLIQTFL